MDRRSATSLFRLKTCDSLSIQRARCSSAVPCSITAKICKKAASRSPIPTPWLTAPAAKALRSSKTVFQLAVALPTFEKLDLHDLSFFVPEMIVDGFDEAIRELLHFILNIAEAVLG